jgi:eukaryotic-like serine/threonine-protein kinase
MDRQAAPAAEDEQRPQADGPPSLSLPRQFGKYTLLRRIAAGGMAELFLALHRSVAGFEKLVVIKRILPSMIRDQEFIDMLLREARIAATLSHPNIVQIFDVGEIDGVYFIAMEHIHGEDIQGILRSMRKKGMTEFPLEHALTIALGTCAGLAYAHEKRDLHGAPLGIVHRDISPRNIVVSFTGDVKIVDFGIAKSTFDLSDDTQEGQLKGKAPYMSPEQASAKPIDWRSDIFSAGVMLFELTTGRRLFRGASEFETLKLICDKDYPRPTHFKPAYPRELERIVMRALAKSREERYQSARELQSDLEDFVREERIGVSQVSLTRWMQSLFHDKLAQQKEALQDVKHLADVIAAQRNVSVASISMDDSSTPGTLSPAGSPTLTFALPQRSALFAAFAVLGVVVLGTAGLFYMRKTAAPEAALIAENEREREREREEPPRGERAVPAEPKGLIEIVSQPESCAIWINGDLRPDVTPARIEKLPLGHGINVKLTKEGFEAYRETVTLSDEQPSKKLEPVLKSASVTVVLKINPPHAVWVDGEAWKGDRRKIEGLSPDEEHKIVVAAQGFAAKTYFIIAKPGETKRITDQLVKGGAKKPANPRKSSPRK